MNLFELLALVAVGVAAALVAAPRPAPVPPRLVNRIDPFYRSRN